MSLLKVKDASYTRKDGRNKVKILSCINFDIEEGDALCILGRNGAGKTTLIKCLLGLLRWDNGEMFLYNKPFHFFKTNIWKIISYIPQAKHNILNLKVIDMIALGLNLDIIFTPKKIHFQKAMQTMEQLNITHLAQKKCFEVSGGEFQMVLFARSLIRDPKILVLDEPESNLDFANQKIILDTLKSFNKKGCTIIINTHFPSHALFLANKALLLQKSHKAQFGCIKEMLTKENLQDIYGVELDICKREFQSNQYNIII